MISKDMKYTALYWALRFVETELDDHNIRRGASGGFWQQN